MTGRAPQDTPGTDWTYGVRILARPCHFCLEPLPVFYDEKPQHHKVCPVCRHYSHQALSVIHREDFGPSEKVLLLCLEADFIWAWDYANMRSFKSMMGGDGDEYNEEKDAFNESGYSQSLLWSKQLEIAGQPGNVEDNAIAVLEAMPQKYGDLPRLLKKTRPQREAVERMVREHAGLAEITKFQIEMVTAMMPRVYENDEHKAAVLRYLRARSSFLV